MHRQASPGLQLWSAGSQCALHNSNRNNSNLKICLPVQTLSQVIAPQLFAVSLFPYLGFLYHLTRAQQQSGAPKLMVFGFYFLLVFVFATIPAGMLFIG